MMLKPIKYIFPFLALLVAACSEEIDSPNNGDSSTATGKGELFGPFSLDIGFNYQDEENRSRADFGDDNGNVKIRDLWVGVFDMDNARIIGSQVFDFDVNISAGQGTALNKDVRLNNLYINDLHPKVFIVGAANVRGVKVPRYLANGEEYKGDYYLDDILQGDKDEIKGIYSINDFVNIVVDVNSAEENALAGYPVMSGMYATATDVPSIFTINSSGVVSQSGNAVYEWLVFDASQNTRKFDFCAVGTSYDSPDPKKPVASPKGVVQLRRMFSRVNVEITAGSGIEVSKPSFQVYNIPNSVFFFERKTVTNGDTYTSFSDWQRYTTSSSDLIADGYTNSKEYGPGESGHEGNFEVKSFEALAANGNNGNNLKFSYWHYENKHWGRSTVTTYNKREERFVGSIDDAHPFGVFSSLCPRADVDFNNNASFMVIRAHVKDSKNGLEGDVEYLIHEGYCCQSNSLAATTAAQASADFATFRNTNYTYNVQINGLNSIRVNVTKDGDETPGVAGDIFDTAVAAPKTVSSNGENFNVVMPEGDIFWALEYQGKLYGISRNDSEWPFNSAWNSISGMAAISSDYSPVSDILANITIDGAPIVGASFSGEQASVLSFANSPGKQFSLYLCTGQVSVDGRSTYKSVVRFDYDDSVLATPVVSAPGISGASFVVGIDDHTFEIEPVEGADTYTITVSGNGTTYTETRNTTTPGTYKIVSSAKGTFTDLASGEVDRFRKVTKDGKDLYLYSVFYGQSRGGLMGLTSGSTYTFTIVASDSKGVMKDSPAVSFTKTVYLPTWNFYEAPWTDTPRSSNDLGENWSKTDKGMTVVRGASTLMYRENTSNSTYKYGFNTGGKGAYSGPGKTTNARYFGFHAVVSGKISALTSNTNDSNATDTRTITGWAGGSTQTSTTQGGVKMSAPATVALSGDMTPDFTVDDNVENYVMITTANLYVYRITFTPTGASRPFHKGFD